MRTKICGIGLGIMLVFAGLAATGCTFSKNDDKKGSIYGTDHQQSQDSTSQNDR